MSHFKNIYKLIWVLLAGFLGGFFAFIVINTFNQKTSTQETIISNPTKTSKVTYKNTTNTTKAVKVIQNAVVSVLNYQAVDTNTSNPASQLFGQENDLKKDDGLALFQ